MGSPLKGIDSDVWLAANPSIAAVNETATNTDSGAWITYKASVHWAWDKRQPLVVQCSPNGSTGWATVTDYVFQYAGGVIVFNTARVAATNNFVRISSGNYFNLTQVDDSSKWSLSLKANTSDTTSFQATGGWARKTGTVKSGSGKVDTFRTDGRILLELGSLVAMQLYVSKTSNYRWEVLGWVTSLDPKSDAQGMVEQGMGFDIEGDAYLRTT